jgi:hypothetical protein
MILTDNEMERVRQCLETQAGLDEELLQRCGHLIHLGAFDEAIRSAFVLLEERLRDSLNKEGITGTRLALDAFYSAAEGKAIIGLVDLLLRLLRRAGELPPPGLLPENVEALLESIEQSIGPGAASRFRSFLGRCVRAGLKPAKGATQWIPYRRYAFTKFDWWDEPKPHNIAVLYHGTKTLSFPISAYYAAVVGFNVDQLVEELLELGFQRSGRKRDPVIDLRTSNDQAFFDSLYELVVRTADNLENTLQQE